MDSTSSATISLFATAADTAEEISSMNVAEKAARYELLNSEINACRAKARKIKEYIDSIKNGKYAQLQNLIRDMVAEKRRLEPAAKDHARDAKRALRVAKQALRNANQSKHSKV